MLPPMPPVSAAFGQPAFGGMQQPNGLPFPQPGEQNKATMASLAPPMQNGQPAQLLNQSVSSTAYGQQATVMNAPGLHPPASSATAQNGVQSPQMSTVTAFPGAPPMFTGLQATEPGKMQPQVPSSATFPPMDFPSAANPGSVNASVAPSNNTFLPGLASLGVSSSAVRSSATMPSGTISGTYPPPTSTLARNPAASHPTVPSMPPNMLSGSVQPNSASFMPGGQPQPATANVLQAGQPVVSSNTSMAHPIPPSSMAPNSQLMVPTSLLGAVPPSAPGVISPSQVMPSSVTQFGPTAPGSATMQGAAPVAPYMMPGNQQPTNVMPGQPPLMSLPSGPMPPNAAGFPPTSGIGMMAQGGANAGKLLPPNMMGCPPVSGVEHMVGTVGSGQTMAMHGIGGVQNAPPRAPGGVAPMAGPPNMMGAPTSAIQQQKPRLDPNLMPSAVQVIDEDRSTRSGPFPTGYPTAEFPPLTTTEYIAQDQGNCNPKFMRTTLYAAPASSDVLKNSQLPFTVAVAPFAPLHPSEMRPPIVDLLELGPIRCHRCKAYMCPYMEFQDGGRRFKCPFCLASTAVEEAYFAHLDHNGRRTDIQQRVEQYLGSYEFVATKPYCKNGIRPKEPAFIFMLDVSYTAVHCGLVSVFCKNIRQMLDKLPRDTGEPKSSLRVGFATYDHTIHFYNLKSAMGQPQMLVVGDITDVFVPLVDGFLVTVDEAETAIQSLLTEIETMFAETRITETMLGPVIEAGLDALKCADRAGKLFIFHTNLPIVEAPGKLKNRDDRKLLGTDKERGVLQPAIDYYGKLGEECVKSGCAVDLFLFPNAFVDVASLSPVCTISGGSLYKYHYFEVQKDGERFLADLAHDISREIAFDVMMRVRTSTGLRPTGFFGSFFMDNSTDMEFGAMDSDKAVHVEIRHDDRLPEGNAYIQSASLFTSCSGQRRLRIHNMALPVSSDYNQLYRVADSHCLVSFLFKQAESMVREKSPKEVRDSVTSRCAQMLATYREKCSEQAPLGQLILPECLKLLPLYGSCIIRNDAISGGSDVTVDDRAWMMQLVASLRIEDTMLLLYPNVFPISDLTLDQPTDEIAFPASVRASYDNLSAEKAYVIYNGLMMFIWIGLGVAQQWVQDVFNANSVTHLNTENHTVPERDNAHSRAVRRVLERINMGRARRMKLFVIRQQDALEAWMKRFLVEDRSSNMPSYVDYLCNIHREIRSLLT
uniref:Protein transport protein Sec24C n=1 Tax=Ascaris suum TaxID=6253 RepID=F1KR98_ASCSU